MDRVESKLSNALCDLQELVIGVAKHKKFPMSSYECIIKKDNTLLTLVKVGNLLGLSTTMIDESQCIVHYFPDNKTLSQMKNDPIEFDKWWKNKVEI